MVIRLPDFLVIEDMRCDFTTLYKTISSRLKLFLPDAKELHFCLSWVRKLSVARQMQNNKPKIDVSIKQQLTRKYSKYNTEFSVWLRQLEREQS